MIRQLTTSQKVFATTILEAESIIKQLKENPANTIKKHSITKREKRTKEEVFEYYIVDVTIEKDSLKNILG